MTEREKIDAMTTEQMLLYVMRAILEHLEAGEACGAIVRELARGAVERAEMAGKKTRFMGR